MKNMCSFILRKEKHSLLKVIFLVLVSPLFSMAQAPLQFVDPLIGTAPATTESAVRHGEGSEQKGQTYPTVGRPFGMTQWTPETRTTEAKCVSPYYYNDKFLTGFRGSHWMDGSCTQDYGTASIMPFTTDRVDTVSRFPTAKLNHEKEFSSPAYYCLQLDEYNIKAEITGTVRCGFFRFTFASDQGNYIQIRVNSDKQKGKIWFDAQHNEIIGYNPVFRIYQGWGQPAGFSGWFVFRFDKPFTVVKSGGQELIVSFSGQKNIQVQAGSSFTTAEAARNNLDAEIKNWDFDQVRKDAENEWNQVLNKIQVKGGTKNDRIKLYTALYHCYLIPRIVSDADGSYQGFAQDTLIHKAVGFDYYDDFSMWDTYRTLHPLMTILEPKRSLDMVKSMIMKAEQGGWMPIFPKWGNYTAAMIGDHVCTMIADAYLRGITDFDAEKAYKYMRQNAFDHPTDAEYKDGKGRRALTSYMKYGYIPLEDPVNEAFHKKEQVSRTLEYALDDYALAQFAYTLGKTEDYKELMRRSQNYCNVFDIKTGYVRGRHADGSWIEPFDPNVKSDFITEGTPFQYTWYVPQDVPGLVKLFGGKSKFLKRLNEFFDKGYYWHGNETDQQAAYMFSMVGVPEKTQEWVREIINDEYGTGPGGLSGNEDGGQMSAWMVSSMLGFYPVCPGKPEYVLGGPYFKEISIQPSSQSKPFVISAKGPIEKCPYIEKVVLNGKPVTGYTIQQKDIVSGGKLIFTVKN